MGIIGDAFGAIFGGSGAKEQSRAAQNAAELQAQAAESAIDEQKRQFNKLVSLMSPYVQSGRRALSEQEAILGIGAGPEGQAQAVEAARQNPIYQAMLREGEEVLLRNAAATGRLRSGDIQRSLGGFAPQLLNQFIQQRYQNLGGLTGLGQASAAGQASAGMSSASNIGNLLGQAGAARAGGTIAAGNEQANRFGTVAGLGGSLLGALF